MENLFNGDHFWALLDNELVVMIKTEYGYFAAGSWEGSISESELIFISKIEKPKAYETVKPYYLDK